MVWSWSLLAEWGGFAAVLAMLSTLCLRMLTEQRHELTRLAARVRHLEDREAAYEQLVAAHERWDAALARRLARLDPRGTWPAPPPLRHHGTPS